MEGNKMKEHVVIEYKRRRSFDELFLRSNNE